MNIQTVDARGLFTKKLVEVYQEETAPKSFLRSFFKTDEADTKEVSIEVKRGTEFVAVDVVRGTEGNRNKDTRASEKIIIPPYYREWIDATSLRFYDRLFGNQGGSVSVETFDRWIQSTVKQMMLLQEKIERSIELQCAQVFQTGIVTLNSATNIDFKRKAGSMVVIGTKWDNAAGKPLDDLLAGAVFQRTIGKARGGTFNVIMGSLAFAAFTANAQVKERADIRNFKLDDLRSPQRDSVGGTLHGEVSSGSYIFRIWTYPEYYDTASTANIPYIGDKNIVMVPEAPKFTLAFGSVPKIHRDMNNAEFPAYIGQEQAAFVIGNFIDPRAEAHVFDVKSAPIAVPTAVDTIYTAQVLT